MGARRNRLALVLLFAALLSLAVSVASPQRYEDFSTPTPLPEGDYLILGFQGGVRAWGDESEGVRRLALNLRAARLPGVHVETVENARRDLALQLVRNALNRDRDGQLDPQERASARVILYGQSFGGAAVVKFARQLEAQGIPVLLTVQIDSVGRDDAVTPSNVRRPPISTSATASSFAASPKSAPRIPRKPPSSATSSSATRTRRSTCPRSLGTGRSSAPTTPA